ncbi:MAG: hypothetical protein KZQ78_00440, partial [Candidatus Thiodiazotropha sp. (ex Ustalcina ferruginea)]|nr:hypothetical protein [Candidatus Thiodiazotropha sp. (ex Ustalcina ferruginea)]
CVITSQARDHYAVSSQMTRRRVGMPSAGLLSRYATADTWPGPTPAGVYQPSLRSPGLVANVAHWGLAEGECMTYSVGFRAPCLQEMASAWFDATIESRLPQRRYRDPPLQPQAAPGEILPSSLNEFKAHLHSCLQSSDQDDRWFGRFITEEKDHLQVFPREQPMTEHAFLNHFREQAVIHRHGYTRMAFTFSRLESDGHDTLYANGQHYTLPSDSGDFLPVITHYRTLHFGYLQEWLEQPIYLALLCQLYNDGHLQFADETA